MDGLKYTLNRKPCLKMLLNYKYKKDCNSKFTK